jgi:hypothetical protein
LALNWTDLPGILHAKVVRAAFFIGMHKISKDGALDRTHEFYRDSMELLQEQGLPFMVGGAYAMACYTGIARDTKDFDICVRASDVDPILELFENNGGRTERPFPHWLAKIFRNDDLIDVIYRAGNGLCEVDDSWFERAIERDVLGVTARIVAPEELIWMKAFIMERERYDGADVAHLLLACAQQINWTHLLARFGQDWRILLSYLILFGYIYPSERDCVPPALIQEMTDRLRAEQNEAAPERVCRGTLLSRVQFLPDVENRGFLDARSDRRCRMTERDRKSWTAAGLNEETRLRAKRPAPKRKAMASRSN